MLDRCSILGLGMSHHDPNVTPFIVPMVLTSAISSSRCGALYIPPENLCWSLSSSYCCHPYGIICILYIYTYNHPQCHSYGISTIRTDCHRSMVIIIMIIVSMLCLSLFVELNCYSVLLVLIYLYICLYAEHPFSHVSIMLISRELWLSPQLFISSFCSSETSRWMIVITHSWIFLRMPLGYPPPTVKSSPGCWRSVGWTHGNLKPSWPWPGKLICIIKAWCWPYNR